MFANVEWVDTRYNAILKGQSRFIQVNGHLALAPVSIKGNVNNYMFSIYLTNKLYHTGMFTSGGYDVKTFSASGQNSDIYWMDVVD